MNREDFEIGDEVICIACDDKNTIIKNKLYTVTDVSYSVSVSRDVNIWEMDVWIINDDENSVCYNSNLFMSKKVHRNSVIDNILE